jgi:hypothetical protein
MVLQPRRQPFFNLVVIGKAKKPRSFKGTKANCIPVHYYNQEAAWIDREIFENWFHKHFVPERWAFLKERGLPLKAAAARKCPFSSKRKCTRFQRWSHHCKVFVLQFRSYYTAHRPRSDSIHEMTQPG